MQHGIGAEATFGSDAEAAELLNQKSQWMAAGGEIVSTETSAAATAAAVAAAAAAAAAAATATAGAAPPKGQ